MTPRTRVAFIDAEQSVAEMVRQFRELRHSRVPVFRGHHDNLIGFVQIETVLPLIMDKADLSRLKPEDIIVPPIVVPLTKKVDEMFEYFQANRARTAVVLNEFGGVEGIVTLRDVLTFIFGHLSGEVHGEALYQERDENIYEVPGDMKLVDFNSLTNFAIEDPRMTTIGGVAFRHLDRLPQIDDVVYVDDCKITVLDMDEQRITRLRVARGEGNGPEAAGDAAAQEAD
jgi:CBS domain containing-hemolysin-like protein